MARFYAPAGHLWLDGWEECARMVHRAVRGIRSRLLVYVEADDTMRTKLLTANQLRFPPDEQIVGTFVAETPIEVIEDSLLEHMRQTCAKRHSQEIPNV